MTYLPQELLFCFSLAITCKLAVCLAQLKAKCVFKGYLYEKMITSQNVSSEAQVKNFFIHRKIMFHSEDIQVVIFVIIPP